MKRTRFFDEARRMLFAGRLNQRQVAGLDAILDYWEAHYPDSDRRWLAYTLASAHHETDRRMQPIREYGRGRGKQYGLPDERTGHRYYGRGLIQLTWRENYARFSPIVGVDLVADPDKALELGHAVTILCHGMVEGMFTGKRLEDYFNAATDDFRQARRIVNGMDCAQSIAHYGRQYALTLRAADAL